MGYTIERIIECTFEEGVRRATEALATEGFGVLTEIDVAATLKRKLDVDFRKYRILGACNPSFAHEALCAEPLVGVMLPCNVVVEEFAEGEVRVAAVDPIASMAAVENETLLPIATEVRAKLGRVIVRV